MVLSKTARTLICLLACFGALPASAFLDFSDGGVLVSTKIVKGMTNEAYSDGYVARYNLFGFRDEYSAAGRHITMSQSRDGIEAEGRGYIEVPPSTWAPNDSGKQSRLRQYVETCVANEHGAKALGEASLYYDIQQRTGAKGLPLALSRELLGQVYLQCGRRGEALSLLQAACSEVDLLTSSSLQKQFKRNLVMAQKSKNFKPDEAEKAQNAIKLHRKNSI
jgi:hypothetical protein